MFWDFLWFGVYRDFMEELEVVRKLGSGQVVQKLSWLLIKRVKKGIVVLVYQDVVVSLRVVVGDKELMVLVSFDLEGGGSVMVMLGNYNQDMLNYWKEMYDLLNLVGLIRLYKVQGVDGLFVGRQVGWSLGGEWCVVVGNKNRVLIYQWGVREKGVVMFVIQLY